MSNTTKRSSKYNSVGARTKRSGNASPTWWIVFTKELADIWIGGKALILALIYTSVLGVMVYVLAFNEELSLIPPKELVYEGIKNAMAVSLFICLIIGADTISGERERNTLESLLLTPASRRQIIIGKFLASISFWPVALIIAIPYLQVLSQGDEILGPAILWGGITGTLLAIAYTGVGMLASFWSNTNKTSYFVSLGIYILFLVPAQLPGTAQTGTAGQFLQWVNPLAATNHFLSKHLVNYRPLSEFWIWLTSPVVFAIVVLGVLLLYAGANLRLEAGKKSRLWSYWSRIVSCIVGLLVITGLIISSSTSQASAFQAESRGNSLQISIDKTYTTLKTGDAIKFNTLVKNNGMEESPPLVVAMNIINLNAQGDTVDPEDWSPQRTQYIKSLTAGQSTNLSWRINTILEGNFMVYMVLIPQPEGTEATSQPVASSGIHITVTPFTRLNPKGVLPYVIGGPLIFLMITILVYRFRRREISTGGG